MLPTANWSSISRGTLTIKSQQCGPPHSHLGHCTGQMYQNLTLTFYDIIFSYFIQSTIQYTSCGTEALPYWNRIEHSQGTPCDVLRMIFCALCDAAATSAVGGSMETIGNQGSTGTLDTTSLDIQEITGKY